MSAATEHFARTDWHEACVMETFTAFISDPFLRLAVLAACSAVSFRIAQVIAHRILAIEENIRIIDEDIYCLREDKADCRAVERELDRMGSAVQTLHDTAEKHDRMLRHMAKMRAAKAAKRAKTSRPALKVAKTA